MNYRLVAILVLIALVVVFILQNTATVDFRFLFWTLTMSRSLMFFILLAMGAAIGWFLRGYAKRLKHH